MRTDPGAETTSRDGGGAAADATRGRFASRADLDIFIVRDALSEADCKILIPGRPWTAALRAAIASKDRSSHWNAAISSFIGGPQVGTRSPTSGIDPTGEIIQATATRSAAVKAHPIILRGSRYWPEWCDRRPGPDRDGFSHRTAAARHSSRKPPSRHAEARQSARLNNLDAMARHPFDAPGQPSPTASIYHQLNGSRAALGRNRHPTY